MYNLKIIMKKRTVLFFIIIALTIGYLIGNNVDLFPSKSPPPSYTYTPQVPQALIGENVAFSDIVKAVSPTVVNISTTKIVKRDFSPFSHFFEGPFGEFFEPFRIPRKWKEQSLGSGVIVSPDGYILTNSHVVEKADEIKVTLYDKRDYKGKIIGSDPKTDIAVIKISTNNLPAIKWGDSDRLQVGEFVLAFGNPYGLSHTVTMGIVSALGRANVGIADYEDFIQTDAAINPGNSGGPLVNIKGELVGINTAIFSKTGGYQGIGFAVPSNMAKSVMEQLIKKGKVTRGWLGVTIQNVTPELAREFSLKKPIGALVTEVFKGSPAEKAGLKRGDVIIEVNGKKIKDVETLRNLVAQSKVGGTIKLKVVRDGRTIFLNATVVELPKEMAEVAPKNPEESLFFEKNAIAGFSVMNLTREIAKQLGLSRNEKGVVIVRVEPYSAAEEAGLKKGDVIQEINKKRVRNLKDFNNIISHIRQGDTLLLFINRSGKRFYVTLKVYS
jgi:serine protease Do